MGVTISRGIAPYQPAQWRRTPGLEERTARTWREAGLRGDVLFFTWSVWGELLELARVYGWEPQGTELALRPGERFNEYWAVGGWQVSSEDARSLGNALYRALRAARDGVPDRDKLVAGQPEAASAYASLRSYSEYRFDAEELVGFLSRGAFEID
jgi:hypothetical protein